MLLTCFFRQGTITSWNNGDKWPKIQIRPKWSIGNGLERALQWKVKENSRIVTVWPFAKLGPSPRHYQVWWRFTSRTACLSTSMCSARLLGRGANQDLGQAVQNSRHGPGLGHDRADHQCAEYSSNQENGTGWLETVLWAGVWRTNERTGHWGVDEFCTELRWLFTCLLSPPGQGEGFSFLFMWKKQRN